MRRLSAFFMCTAFSLAFIGGGIRVVSVKAAEKEVYVGGMPAGFTLKTGGVQIIGLNEVCSENGTYAPASSCGLRAGDIIQKAGGISVDAIADLNEIVDKTKGNPLKLEVLRGKEVLQLSVLPVKERVSNRYKIGVLVRESVSGIGTVTYIDKATGRFGALGHSVVGENQQEMQISCGFVYECSIVGICKGVRGKAGELKGLFINDKQLGNAEKLCECGIFGEITQEFKVDGLMSAVSSSSNVKPGNAYIYSTVSGVSPEKYEIEIVKVDKLNKDNKNYVIKVTDEKLISETGGIVQGMSGSPILQEGRLVGAVTHVFLNDPTRGYGIDIERMMSE